MNKIIGFKAMALVSMLLLTNQAFTLVDSTTDNQLPSMRGVWQDREYSACQLNSGEMDLELDSNADVTGNIVKNPFIDGYEDTIKNTDIDTIQSGGDYTNW